MRQLRAVASPRNPHATFPGEKWSSLGDASFEIGAFIVLLDVITLIGTSAAYPFHRGCASPRDGGRRELERRRRRAKRSPP
jgi:hypothetical protein